MSIHVDWYSAHHTSVAVVAAGTKIGEDVVGEDALVVDDGSGMASVFEGSPAHLADLVSRAAAALTTCGTVDGDRDAVAEVCLQIRYRPTQVGHPSRWNWPELLDMADPADVVVVSSKNIA